MTGPCRISKRWDSSEEKADFRERGNAGKIGEMQKSHKRDWQLYKTVSFDTMIRKNKRKEWEDLYEQTKGCDVCIKDDVIIENTEMEPYKCFYLKAYYFCLLKHSKNLYVVM